MNMQNICNKLSPAQENKANWKCVCVCHVCVKYFIDDLVRPQLSMAVVLKVVSFLGYALSCVTNKQF